MISTALPYWYFLNRYYKRILNLFFNYFSIQHGANMVMKGAPWYPPVLLEVDNIKEMSSWGFNTIRLGVMWSGVEPQQGIYNETYLAIIVNILDNFEANGIHGNQTNPLSLDHS